LQVEARIQVAVEPLVEAIDLALSPPTLEDQLADTQRLRKALAGLGYPDIVIDFPLLGTLSDVLREQSWQARLALCQDRLIAVLPPGARLLGLAVDIGTTKLAGYLVDLTSGETIAKAGAMNPQIAYGEDVTAGSLMHRRIPMAPPPNPAWWTLNAILSELCAPSGALLARWCRRSS
jgi:uncharacterized 2Fe-2S/4Fe-4S cluster protein (DUF4445 family)